MKKILLFIFLLLGCKTFSQNENIIPESIIVKNKIEEIQIFNITPQQKYLSEQMNYNNSGKMVKNIFFDKNGTAWIENSFQYNEQQQRVSVLDQSNVLTKYKYNQLGNKIESKSIKPDSTVLSQNKMVYNEKNQLVKIFNKKYNSDDFYLNENRFYKDDGQESKREKFNDSGKLIFIEEFEYDKNKNLIFIYHQSANNKKNITKYDYNKNGELTKVEYTATGATRKYKYDKSGNRVEEKYYDKNDEIIKHREYKYKVFE